jgi:alditol oxidase
MTTTRTNWAGNYTYSAARWHQPDSLPELQDLVARTPKLRVVGTRHSFNALADTSADALSLERLPSEIALDPASQTVTVSGAVRYGDLGRALHAAGYAVHNLASLPHISVAGACATATHGSGDRHGNLATVVTALELVTATGEVITLSRASDSDIFGGAVVSLGALGVVTRLTLKVVPTFELRQDVYEDLPLAQVDAHFDEITSLAYSVSLFTDWRAPRFNQLWVKRVVPPADTFAPPATLFGSHLADRPLHPIPGASPINCTEQLGRPGPWHERLPHFKLEFTPSSGDELQAEYLVPRPQALGALHAIAALREHIAPLLQASEIRTVAADQLWLSQAYGQACVGFHFTWLPDWPAVRALLPHLEAALAPFQARPHWGKLFTLPPAHLQALYPRLPDFRRLLARFDPGGKFRNDFIDTYIGPAV